MNGRWTWTGWRGLVATMAVLCWAACDGGSQPATPGSAGKPMAAGASRVKASATSADTLGVEEAPATWVGDLDTMAERGVVRVATTVSRTYYFFEAGEPQGAVHRALETLEQMLGAAVGEDRSLTIEVVTMAAEDLISALVAGRVDLVATNLEVTPERQDVVTFSEPIAKGVRDILVTGPAAPLVTHVDDVAKVALHVPAASRALDTARQFSIQRQAAGRAALQVQTVDDRLDVEGVLELVAAGVFPATVVGDDLAASWAEAMSDLEARPDIAMGKGYTTAWALRHDSPTLTATVNAFLRQHHRETWRASTLLRHLPNRHGWVSSPLSAKDLAVLEPHRATFERYGDRYDVDWLLAAAQAFQESKLDQRQTSPAGAVGIMQIKPSTAADPHVAIADIRTAEGNIHAGIKYLAFLRDRYFSDESLDEVDQLLLALAAYNAGPRRILRVRATAEERGFDPDRWFRHVEMLAPHETTVYVGNIFKYYVSYLTHFRGDDERDGKDDAASG